MKILINNEEEFKLVLKKLGATYHTNRKSIKDLTVTINWDSSKLINKIKEEMISMQQFTKSDLHDGMVVMTRLGIPYLYLNGEFIGHKYSIRNMKEDLTHLDAPSADIVEVFITKGHTFNSIFRQDYLTSIWKRPNLSINELKTEISQLQEQLHKLTTELSDLEAK